MGAAMATSDVKAILGITTTNGDAQIGDLLYPSAAFADVYCNYGLSRFIQHRDGVYVTLGTSTALKYISNLAASTAATAPYQWISPDTVLVVSSNGSETYEEDRDYEIDYEAGTICSLGGSTNGTSTGGDVLIDFAYIDLSGSRRAAQKAIAQIIWTDVNVKPGIASESAGPLSRSYTQNGIPPSAMMTLKPFRRPCIR
jgi:hypothetical protein